MNKNNSTLVVVKRSWPISIGSGQKKTHKLTVDTRQEYKIVTGSKTVLCTIGTVGARVNSSGKSVPTLIPKLIFEPGLFDVVKLANPETDTLDLCDITSITPVFLEYEQSDRNIAALNANSLNNFTFAFDNHKHPNKFKIKVFATEFVMLRIATAKLSNDGLPMIKAIFGHITDVDTASGIIHFNRYISNPETREVVPIEVAISNLVGIRRYSLVERELKKENKTDKTTVTKEAEVSEIHPDEPAEEAATENTTSDTRAEEVSSEGTAE
jgi:hypothetical protein